jgi:hypothetical protein
MPLFEQPKQGFIRAQIILHEKALRIFSQQERNAILREGMRQVGLFWANIFLPKRFTDYAKSLGYHISMKYEKAKRARFGGDAPPLIWSGDMARAIQAGTNVVAKSTKDNPSATVKMPTGHALNADGIVQHVLQTVPQFEVKRVAEVFAKTIVGLINGAATPSPERMQLTIQQRQTLGIKPRASYGSKPIRRRTTYYAGA